MPADPRDYRLDLADSPRPAPAPPPPPRPWLGVRFDCCGAYQRVYLHRDGDRYEGRCPRACEPSASASAPAAARRGSSWRSDRRAV